MIEHYSQAHRSVLAQHITLAPLKKTKKYSEPHKAALSNLSNKMNMWFAQHQAQCAGTKRQACGQENQVPQIHKQRRMDDAGASML